MEQIINLVVYLFAVSVAVERAVDILKRAVIQKFNLTTVNGAVYQLLSTFFGCVIATVDHPSFDFVTTNRWLMVVIIGLAASGGSSAWNTVLSILKELSLSKPVETK